MRITQLLKLLLLTSFLSGCWVLTVKDEAPGPLGNTDLLDSFIGQESESVVRKLGLPDEFLSDGDKHFMVYSATSAGTNLLMVLYIPAWADTEWENVIHCLRFELDSDNFVRDYQVKSKQMQAGFVFYTSTQSIDLKSNCREVFWNKEEITNLRMATDFDPKWIEISKRWEEQEKIELLEQAELGNTDAQLALFKNLSKEQPEAALIWLCKSADSGDQEARIILKQIYEYGGYPWIKEGIVERDFRLAYVWYALSGVDLSSRQTYLNYLTSEERLDAEKMLEDWRPGQCERDLGLVSVTE